MIQGHTSYILLGVATLALFVLALEVGYRMGAREAGREEKSAAQLGTIQGATLGLLGLLLGFSFAGAAGRFMERQDLIAREANAIGTAWLRAGLLPEPHGTALREGLERYRTQRVELSRNLQRGLSEAALADIAELQRGLWRAAKAGVRAEPALAVAVLPPVNEVLDLHALRMASGRKHLPTLVMGLLVLCSVLALGTIGFGTGIAGRRNLFVALSLAVLVAAALVTTVDMDHPRLGLIRLDDLPLIELDLRE